MKKSAIDRLRESWSGMQSSTRGVIVISIYTLFFTVGTLGHYVASTRHLMLSITPGFLLLFGASAIAPLWRDRQNRSGVLLWATGTLAVTFALEAIGVATGAVFGAYAYGPTLGLKVFHVPLIIGFNWVVVVLASVELARRLTIRMHRWIGAPVAVVLTGVFAVAFDVVLEPVAMRFDYWQWDGGTVPLQNYIAWFFIAAAVAAPYIAARVEVRSSVPMIYVVAQYLFLLSLIPLSL